MITLPVPSHLQLRKEPKQKRTQALLANILDTTANLVREQGYQAVNTNLIAERAQIDIKSLYEFFPNKESILYKLADDWLLGLREKCVSFEQECFQDLSWRDYFAMIHQNVTTDASYSAHFISLHGLWDLLPDFSRLDEFHQKFVTQFYLRQLKRLGCVAPIKQQKTLCLFMLALEDGIGANLVELSTTQRKALWQMQFETLCFHLEKIMPSD